MGIADAIRNHPSFSSAIGGAVVGAGAVAIAGAVRRRVKKRVARRTTTTRRATTTARKTKRKTKTPAQKRRARAFRTASSKKIRFTKNGQPFIILKSGKARFISKKSARSRKIRKGGFR